MLSERSQSVAWTVKLAALRQAPRDPNPFILGTPTVERILTAMAQRDRFKTMK